MAPGYTLIIGDKNFSSWSLRPWIAMKRSASLSPRSGSGCASLRAGQRSCVIRRRARCRRSRPTASSCATASPSSNISQRAIPSYIVAAGCGGARCCPLDRCGDAFGLRRVPQRDVDGAAGALPYAADRRRARPRHQPHRCDLAGTQERYGAGGPFLFGAFSNADAMYAPVTTRFRTYGVDLAAFGDDGKAAAYAEAILASPEMAEWTEGAEAEVKARLVAKTRRQNVVVSAPPT